jgi:hypothetical protein
LRSAGLRGSNVELGAIARLVKNSPQAGPESLGASAPESPADGYGMKIQPK